MIIHLQSKETTFFLFILWYIRKTWSSLVLYLGIYFSWLLYVFSLTLMKFYDLEGANITYWDVFFFFLDYLWRCYVDSDYTGDLDCRRFMTGYVFMFTGGPICWKSTLHDTIALSTAKAEYMAVTKATKEPVLQTTNICISLPFW